MRTVLHCVLLAVALLACAVSAVIASVSGVIVMAGLSAETGPVALPYRVFVAAFAVLPFACAYLALRSSWRPSHVQTLPTTGWLIGVAVGVAMWATTALGLSAS